MKNLPKYIITSLLLLVLVVSASAQITTQDETVPAPNITEKKKHTNNAQGTTDGKYWTWDKFYVGGIPGFGISDYYITVSVAAEVGYFFHPHIAGGLMMDYSYVRDKYFGVSYNVIRFGPYVRGYIWKGIFAQAQYELTTIKNFREAVDSGTGTNGGNYIVIPRLNNSSLLLGGGYHDNFESGFGFYFSVLFNVLNASSSLSTNPEFQVGLTYRLNGGGYKKHKKKNNGSATAMPVPE